MISAGSDILASDVIAASTGASDAGKLGKTDSNGKFDNSFLYDSVRQRYQFTAGAAISAAGIPLHLSPYCQTDGGVTLVNQAAQTSGSTLSFNAGSGSNRALLVSVDSTSAPSGVTYNGVSMTLVDSQALGAASYTQYLYKLIAPATGSNTISVSGGSGTITIAAASFAGVHQTTFVEASAKNGGAGTTASVNLTTATAGAHVHAFASQYSTGNLGTITPTVTFRGKYNYAATTTTTFAGSAAQCSESSSNLGKVNEAQTLTVDTSWTNTNGTVGSSVIAISLAPATAVSSGVIPASSAAVGVNEPLIDFVGWSESSASVGGSVYATFGGGVSGLTGLTAGKPIYLQDTAGTYGHTRGTYGKIIGRALSSTEATIRPEKTNGAPISKITAYQYTAECDGFLTVGGVSATATIVTDGNTMNITGTATNGGTITFPVSRGKTYTITGTTNLYFIPFA